MIWTIILIMLIELYFAGHIIFVELYFHVD